jgi:hypothetical protein
MRVTSTIVIQDPVDAWEMSAAAAQAAGLPAPAHGWDLLDLGALNILRMDGGSGGVAEVSVHFAADGGPIADTDQHDPLQPEGYALVCVTMAARGDPAEDRARHEQLIQALGLWLAGRVLGWAWQYDDGPWMASHPGRPRCGARLLTAGCLLGRRGAPSPPAALMVMPSDDGLRSPHWCLAVRVIFRRQAAARSRPRPVAADAGDLDFPAGPGGEECGDVLHGPPVRGRVC